MRSTHTRIGADTPLSRAKVSSLPFPPRRRLLSLRFTSSGSRADARSTPTAQDITAMSEIATRTPQQELVAQIRSDGSQQQIAAALKGSGIAPEKFVRVAVTAINENADLVNADRNSLFSSLMRCAQDGLLPDGREAALVMFGKRATYMPMVGGLRKIAAEYGWSIVAFIVHENDGFDPDVENAKANYRPARLGTDPGDALGAYALGQHRDGRRLLEVMTLQEIEDVRKTSRAANKGPWVDWWGEMARKTVVRRLFKALPLDPKDRERIDRVIASSVDMETGEVIDHLYGTDDSATHTADRTPRTPTDPPPSGATSDQQASGSPPGGPGAPGPDIEEAEWTDAQAPFEGEEPPPVTDEPQAASEPTFVTGRYEGRTIAEVYSSGADGLSYVKWAVSSWKTEPLRGALDRFAETHPDVKA